MKKFICLGRVLLGLTSIVCDNLIPGENPMKHFLAKVFSLTICCCLLLATAVPGLAMSLDEGSSGSSTAIELLGVESSFFVDVRSAEVNRSISGYLSGRYTANYYEITIPAEGYINIDFEHEDLNEDENNNAWRIALLDYEENEIYRFSSRLNDKKVSSPNIGLAAKTYYVRIDRPLTYTYSDDDYTLRVNHTENRYWEQEPNETPSDAAVMSINRTYHGSLHNSRDIDYFNFDLPSDGYIAIDFSHNRYDDIARGWRITLLTEDRVEFFSFSSAWNEPELHTANIGLERGKYFVRIDRPITYLHNDADYAIKVNFSEDSNREIEPNDVRTDATEIRLNRPYAGSLHSSRDIDFYTFEMSSAGDVNMHFKHETSAESRLGWRITLLDHDTAQVTTFNSRRSEPEVTLGEVELEQGKYYVRVDSPLGFSHSKKDYILTVSSEQLSPREPSEWQPGDVNNDGRINVLDVTLVTQHILGYEFLSSRQQGSADVDGNGRIDVNDVNLIMQMVLGYIDRFPVE